jgi:hypothetical protein
MYSFDSRTPQTVYFTTIVTFPASLVAPPPLTVYVNVSVPAKPTADV